MAKASRQKFLVTMSLVVEPTTSHTIKKKDVTAFVESRMTAQHGRSGPSGGDLIKVRVRSVDVD